MILAYCDKCKTETNHNLIKKDGFLMQCAIAFVTKFTADLRQHDLECNCCGNKRDY